MRNIKIPVVCCAFVALAVTGGAEPIPAPVDGVVTIDTAVNVVYDEALPATANTLVKKGKGTATLTVASPDFAPEGGQVLVEDGTLALSDASALGRSKDTVIVVGPAATLSLRGCADPVVQAIVVEVDKADKKAGRILADAAANVLAGSISSRPARDRQFEVLVASAGDVDGRLTWSGASVISNQVRKTGAGTLVVTGRLEMIPESTQRFHVDVGQVEFAAGAVVTNVDFRLQSGAQASGALFSGGDLSFSAIDTGFGAGQNTRPIRQTGGDVRILSGSSASLFIGHNFAGNMGSYYLEGGTLAHAGVQISCVNTTADYPSPARGVFVQRGGRMTRMGGNLAIGQYGSAVWHQTGGTNDNNAASFGENTRLGQSTAAQATVAVEGSNTLFETGFVRWGSDAATGRIVVAARDGGTLALHKFAYGGASAHTCDASLFFDGGVLQILCTGYLSNNLEKPDGIFVGERGIVIDTSDCRGIGAGSVRTDIGEAILDIGLTSLSGLGLASVSLPQTEAFRALTYKGPAIIDIEGAGRGAAAYADWDFENACLVPRVLAPGYGLDAESTKVYIWSPDGKSRHECAFTLKAAPTSGAGLTKRGAGSLNLLVANSHRGLTTVESGQVRMTHPDGIPSGTGVILSHGTQLLLRTNTLHVAALGGQGRIYGDPNADFPNAGRVTLASGGTIYVKAAEIFGADWTPLSCLHGLTVGAGVKVVVTDPENLPEGRRQTKTLLEAGANRLDVAEVPTTDLEGGRVTRNGSALVFSYRKKTGLLLILR